MPLFPPVTDTLRWDDLVHQGRAQLPLVSPDWTDQNTSDVGIALLELLAYLVEADSYRSSAVTDRERRRLLALAGYVALPARPATALVRFTGSAGRYVLPKGLLLAGTREDGSVPLTLLDDVAVTGATVSAVASAAANAEADDYRSGCSDLSRALSAGQSVAPFGPDPSAGDAVLVGLSAPGGLTVGPLDIWLLTAADLTRPETASAGPHHDVVTSWEAYDGTAWQMLAGTDVRDDTAALTRSGRVRLQVPTLPVSLLGDQTNGELAGRGCVWVRCRIVSGRHDVAPSLAAAHADVGRVVASQPYDGAVLGSASGVPAEAFSLPEPWCGPTPSLQVVDPDMTTHAVAIVADPVLAGPQDRAACLDPDGVTVRFGDGRCGGRLVPGAKVVVEGTWTTDLGVGDVRPPLALAVPADAHDTGARLVASLEPGSPPEDVARTAARAERDLWAHDRLTEALRARGATSLDDLPLDVVRALPVPERAVTAADLERLALATAGTTAWRVRALPEVDPRLPGLRADGCVTVMVVPSLPADEPSPSAGLLRQVRARLAATRTLGTRIFVTGPEYVRVGVRAALVLLPGAAPGAVTAAAREAVDTFLHPITGGPSGRGWPFGRAVRRSEVLQLLDAVPGVDRVDGLALSREPGVGDCGDLTICPTQLVLAGTIDLTATPGGWS